MTQNEQHLKQLIDSCQPGDSESEQLIAENDLADLAARTHALDRLLAEALADVEIPVGLEDRLLDGLLEAGLSADAGHQHGLLSEKSLQDVVQTKATDQHDVVTAVQNQESRSTGRRTAIAGIVVAAVAAVILAIAWRPTSTETAPYPASELAGRVAQWLPRLETAIADTAGWQQASIEPPLAYLADRQVVPHARSWREFETRLDPQAVIWDLSSRRYGEVYLVVLRPSERYSLPEMPLRRLTSSGQWSLGAWQTGDTLYVLVGGRGVRSLDRLIRQPVLG